MNCVNELLSKNCVPVEFEEFLLKLFQQTFQLLQRITKDTGARAIETQLSELDDKYEIEMGELHSVLAGQKHNFVFVQHPFLVASDDFLTCFAIMFLKKF